MLLKPIWKVKLPKLNWPLIVRRVSGKSMLPTLQPGQLVVAVRPNKTLQRGQVVVLSHDGIEKVKRIAGLAPNGIEVRGDNESASTDSRQFGLIDQAAVIGLVIWPRISKRQ